MAETKKLKWVEENLMNLVLFVNSFNLFVIHDNVFNTVSEFANLIKGINKGKMHGIQKR